MHANKKRSAKFSIFSYQVSVKRVSVAEVPSWGPNGGCFFRSTLLPLSPLPTQEAGGNLLNECTDRYPEKPVRVWFKAKIDVLYSEDWWTWSTGLGM